MSFTNAVLEGSRLDFGGLRPPFWRLQSSILRLQGSILWRFLQTFAKFLWSNPSKDPSRNLQYQKCKKWKNAKNAKNARNAKTADHFRNANPWIQSRRPILSQGLGRKWGGGGAPPQGVSMKFTATVSHRTIFFKSLLACVFGPKNLPKTLPKQGPNP